MTEKDNQNTSDKAEVAKEASKVTKKANKKAKRRGGSSASTSKAASRKSGAGEPATVTSDTANASAQPAPADPAGAPSSGKGLSIAALLFSLVALVGAGYAWYQTAVNARLAGGEQGSRISALEKRFQLNDNSQSGVAEQLGELRQLVGSTESGLNAQISDLRTAASQQQQQVASEVAGVREDFTNLSSSIGDMKNELRNGVEQWGQREVEHLLTIANQRLQLAGDPEGALTALRLADERLQDLGDPTLLNVRQALGSEIAALSDISAPDIASATAEITLLSQSLGNLPLKGETRVPDAVESESAGNSTTTPEAGSAAGQIVSIGRSFFSDLGSLVQVEKDGEPVAPTITPEVGRLVVALGRLTLEGAQVALIRSQPAVFHDRLDAASAWVSENFQGESDLTRKWLGQLDELKGFSPQTSYPDISGSLKAMRNATSAEGQNQ